MIITERDSGRLESFTVDALEFLRSKTANKYYADDSTANNIRLLDGTIVPLNEEAIFVLDNEFEAFIVGNLVKYVELLLENVGNRMFGLGERTLYEYVTGWLFLAVSGKVEQMHIDRMKALLFAGFYKDVDSISSNYDKYIARRGEWLEPKDMQKLDECGFTEFNDYIWKVLSGVVGGYPIARKGTLDRLGGAILYKHQSMRLHANPNAMAELLSDLEKTTRHRLVIAFNLRQAVEFYRGDRVADSLVYRFDKLWRENTIRES